MKKSISHVVAVSAAALLAVPAFAEAGDGIKLLPGRNLTLKPYVRLGYTYDSNVDSTKHATKDSIFFAMPGLNANYRKDSFEIDGGAWYRYSSYCRYANSLNKHSYGETLTLKKTWWDEDQRGWAFRVREAYRKINQSDSITSNDGGRGIWRDRDQFDVDAALSQRFTRFHWTLDGAYNRLHYENDDKKYGRLYGYNQWAGGVELGWKFSKWTDALVYGSYARYTQQRSGGISSRYYSNHHNAVSLLGGVGSHMLDSERMNYRALVGWSRFDYGESHISSGWIYTLNWNWRFAKKWQVHALGSSYYKPSEYAYGSAVKTYTLGAGLTYRPVEKWTFTGDITYRKQKTVYSSRSDYSWDANWLAVRAGADYAFTKWLSVYGTIDYTSRMTSAGSKGYDYDRFRGTVGLHLKY